MIYPVRSELYRDFLDEASQRAWWARYRPAGEYELATDNTSYS